MIFYLIPAVNGQYEELAGTQNDARQLCKAKGIKFNAEAMTHDIPTSKWELMNYVNVLMAKAGGYTDPIVMGVDVSSGPDQTVGAVIKDGKLERFMSQDEIDQMFEPASSKPLPDVDTVCKAISSFRGAAIGHVAHELAARVERLAKEVAV